ncbi:MAG: ZIP family metal transporter [Gammaproteobacteria bacterium]|nr:ZIP family metal transporter [Gammaproteobacteria bacterium]
MVLSVSIFAAALVCTLISLCAAYVFMVSDATFKHWTPSLIAIACGVLLGDAFLHLLPEALESAYGTESILTWTLVGIVIFFTLEQMVKRQYSRIDATACQSSAKRLPIMNLSGDALHNTTDGILIATSFMADTTMGIATTVAILLHEIPQEITDIAVLVRGGWSKSQAFACNLVCALLTPISAILTLVMASYISFDLAPLLAITAGGFVYIALANLMPELVPVREHAFPIPQFGTVLIGVLSMQMLLWVE